MIEAILTDLDGVIRLWNSDDELTAAEAKLGLPKGTVFKSCFAQGKLIPAITGQITDGEWRTQVTHELTATYGRSVAEQAVQAWNAVSFDIDEAVLNLYWQHYPNAKLILVTNATSRLNADLALTTIGDRFHAIINSSEVAIAKPDEGIFRAALAAGNATPSEAIFVDDSKTNVDAAAALGMHAYHYTGKEGLDAFLAEIN